MSLKNAWHTIKEKFNDLITPEGPDYKSILDLHSKSPAPATPAPTPPAPGT